MNSNYLYHYKKSRHQQSKLFIRMALMCLFYIAAMYGYEAIMEKSLPQEFKSIGITAFSVSSAILFSISWWLRSHPAVYEAYITKDRFVVNYPESEQWSFNVKLVDIKRFEHRNTHSHAGKGIGQSGILLTNGQFFQISMNYGNNINHMYKAVKSVHPQVTYPKKINKKFTGPINKDFDD